MKTLFLLMSLALAGAGSAALRAAEMKVNDPAAVVRSLQFISEIGIYAGSLPGSEPLVGQEAFAGVGDSVYREFNTVVRVRSELREPAVLTKSLTLAARTELIPTSVVLWESRVGHWFCSSTHEEGAGLRPRRAACLLDEDLDGVFERSAVRGYGAADPKVSAKYDLMVSEGDEVLRYVAGSGLQRELLFQGAAGGVLRLGYREFINGTARPAFGQDATYDLAASGTTLVSFKGVQLEVLEAGNSGIRYKVISGFSQ